MERKKTKQSAPPAPPQTQLYEVEAIIGKVIIIFCRGLAELEKSIASSGKDTLSKRVLGNHPAIWSPSLNSSKSSINRADSKRKLPKEKKKSNKNLLMLPHLQTTSSFHPTKNQKAENHQREGERRMLSSKRKRGSKKEQL